jgi:PIN domain nuclease of toxin-antitoxin system
VRLLLDTHALIWLVHAPERLSTAATAAVTAEGAEVHASHVSLWEMAIKRGNGKLGELDRPAADWFEHFVPRSGLRPLPIAATHLGAVEHLPLLHRDPFDRLLVVQAQHERLELVTADPLVAQYTVDVVW